MAETWGSEVSSSFEDVHKSSRTFITEGSPSLHRSPSLGSTRGAQVFQKPRRNWAGYSRLALTVLLPRLAPPLALGLEAVEIVTCHPQFFSAHTFPEGPAGCPC